MVLILPFVLAIKNHSNPYPHLLLLFEHALLCLNFKSLRISLIFNTTLSLKLMPPQICDVLDGKVVFEKMLPYLLQWVPEITHHCPKTPFLLVGLEIELRDDPEIIEKLAKVRQKPVTKDAAEKLARELKAAKYVECSAITQKGLKNVFDEAILVALEQPEPIKRRWFHMPKISFPSLFRSKSCMLFDVCLNHATESHYIFVCTCHD